MPKIEYTKAIIIGIALKNELQYLLFYIQESTILFLYTVLNYEGRSTTDIDFMLRRMSNDVRKLSASSRVSSEIGFLIQRRK